MIETRCMHNFARETKGIIRERIKEGRRREEKMCVCEKTSMRVYMCVCAHRYFIAFT